MPRSQCTSEMERVMRIWSKGEGAALSQNTLVPSPELPGSRALHPSARSVPCSAFLCTAVAAAMRPAQVGACETSPDGLEVRVHKKKYNNSIKS